MNNKYLINFSYDGSNYQGYGTQKHKNTIQDELERVLEKIFKSKIKTYATSRTDSKVHALDMYMVINGTFNIECNNLKKAINSLTNEDICVKKIVIVDNDYFPRYDVISKTYKYVVVRKDTPLMLNYRYKYLKELDIEKMRKASTYLLGKHDFTTFCNPRAEVETKVRTINTIEIVEEKEEIMFYINGDGFLYNMVRIIIGTLLEIGSSKEYDPELVKELLELKDRSKAFFTAPAQGLYLYKTYLMRDVRNERNS